MQGRTGVRLASVRHIHAPSSQLRCSPTSSLVVRVIPSRMPILIREMTCTLQVMNCTIQVWPQ